MPRKFTAESASKKGRKYKPSTKYTKKIGQELCRLVEEGGTVSSICKKYPDVFPHNSVIWRWHREVEEFKHLLNDAYRTQCYQYIDELNDLTKLQNTLSVADIKSKYRLSNPMDISNQLKLELAAIKNRIDAIKFSLSKIAPKISPELSDRPKQEVNVDITPQILIANYSPDPSQEPLENTPLSASNIKSIPKD